MTSLEIQAISAVSAAILAGRVVRATSPSRAWGVRAASGEWCSDHWTGAHGEGHAIDRARRLTGSSFDRTVFHAEIKPDLVSTVGPMRLADGSLEFRCLAWPGGVQCDQFHLVPHIDHMGLDHDAEDDPSAFAAARAFVERHGVEAALAAVESAKEAA